MTVDCRMECNWDMGYIYIYTYVFMYIYIYFLNVYVCVIYIYIYRIANLICSWICLKDPLPDPIWFMFVFLIKRPYQEFATTFWLRDSTS
jgi:hypothetical protein